MSKRPKVLRCPRCMARYYIKDKPWKLVCLDCWLEDKAVNRYPTQRGPAPAPSIEPEMLRRLIQLCHPDKHGGSEAAQEATRYLLSLKRGAAP